MRAESNSGIPGRLTLTLVEEIGVKVGAAGVGKLMPLAVQFLK